jgi:2-polyprenyl-6-methoxyphenol hydroxylase-like FAD-dependent oxidoreductase
VSTSHETPREDGETDTDVLVVGAGPTGLMLAFELALAGARTIVVEKAEQPNPQSRAGGIQPRTAEVLDMRGLLDEISDPATRTLSRVGHFAGLPIPLDYTSWNTPYPATLGIWQGRIERHLERRLTDHGTPVERGHEVLAVAQDEHGVDITTERRRWRARYLVACDGAHSTVRRLCDIPFPGHPATTRSTVVDLELTGDTPAPGLHFSDYLHHAGDRSTLLHPLEDGRFRMVFGRTTANLDETAGGPVTHDEVADALRATHGDRVHVRAVLVGSRFTDATRQVEQYRHGRILLAGDAAHIHSPHGGQGVNLGIQDAVNLGWKLATHLRGDAPAGLLDSYHAERHPAAAQVLQLTLAQRAIMNPVAPESGALRELMLDLARLPDVVARLSGLMSGLALRYRLPGPEHPLLGTRAPETTLATDSGPRRLAELLHPGRAIALLLADLPRPELPDSPHAPLIIRADPTPELPAGAVLVRPDGYIGWAGDDTTGLTEALATWITNRTPTRRGA